MELADRFKKKSHSIYIGSINPELTEQSLKSYFKALGHELRFLDKKKKKRSKNYIIAKTSHQKTFHFLTQVKTNHSINNLEFFTAEYLTGKEKLLRDKEDAKKKIYVGNLPSDMTNQEFREVFERYGSTKVAYISKKVIQGNEGRASDSFGFIVFESEETANLMIRLGTVPFKGLELIIKPFRLKSKKLKDDEFGEGERVSFGWDTFNLGSFQKMKILLKKFKKWTNCYDEKDLLEFIKTKHIVDGHELRFNW